MGLTPPFAYRQDRLYCEELSLEAIAEQFGTPLYVYSKKAIGENYRSIEDAFGGAPHLSTYAAKANSNMHLLTLIAGLGCGADVGSAGELFLALKAGFPPEKISFSGVGKRDDEIEFAVRNDVHAFNAESRGELDAINTIAGRLGRRARILIRLNLDIDAGTHAYISTSQKHNKFGISALDAVEVFRYAQTLRHLEVRGIHSHLGSQILNVEIFVKAAKALASLVADLRAHDIPVTEIDFGGGFGVQYHGVLAHPDLPHEKPETTGMPAATVIRAVLPVLGSTGCNITIQPGRSLVANAGVFLASVLYIKRQGEKAFVIVDGGMNDLIRPSLYHAHHQIVPVVLTNAAFEPVDVVGPCCESGDFFALGRMLPQVERGNLLALMCAGAYGFALSSNYNARLRPAEVLVDGSSSACIREREQLDRLLQ